MTLFQLDGTPSLVLYSEGTPESILITFATFVLNKGPNNPDRAYSTLQLLLVFHL